ncbi:uncharacterized protein LOC122375507 isoform X2 [Amphibalanus amphitrite]|uniref:uncharacterized protein LOC122375507 isoform X2 n=1 Tax=Amphibalanus amphitrite TaxID=1232801 RepID=UPI001C92A1E1|nr:uncharacterized protein LOC122375507 isoform X2 [Amphibalanus amphitrite]
MSEPRGRLEVPAERPRPRLPPLTAALDSSDDSGRYASREYRSRQAKRRRRAKLEAQRADRTAAGDSADSATLRSHGAPDDSAAGDTTYRRETSFDASYRREPSAEASGHRRDLSGDLSYRRELSGDSSRREGALELASEPAEMSITDELSRLGEEVRSGSEAGGDLPPSLLPEHVPQPAVTKLYIEKGSRFHAAKRQTATRSAGAAYSKKSQARAVDLALQTQRLFAPLGRLCFGLLAGLTLAHLMFVAALTRDGGRPLDFVSHYSPLALPFRAVFFTMSVVCCVAALDRYDVSRASAARLRRSLTLQDGGVTVLLYLAVLAVSTCLAPTDDRLHLYRRNGTAGLWESTAAVRGDCRLMVVLCAVRAGLALLAWLVVAANPALDRVLQHLRQLSAAGRVAEPPAERGAERPAGVATIS